MRTKLWILLVCFPIINLSAQVEEANKLLHGFCRIEDKLQVLYDEMWGKEVTFAQLLQIGCGLGLEAPLKEYTPELLGLDTNS